MSWSYDPEVLAARDQVRLLIGDTDQDDADNHYFSNEELDAFLAMESSIVKLAAAQALDTLASSEVLIQKRIKLLDLSTDGPAESKELRARASDLRDEVYAGDENLPDFAEMVVDAHTYSERLWKQRERNS